MCVVQHIIDERNVFIDDIGQLIDFYLETKLFN